MNEDTDEGVWITVARQQRRCGRHESVAAQQPLELPGSLLKLNFV